MRLLKTIKIAFLILFLTNIFGTSEINAQIPSAKVKNLQGNAINTNEIKNNGKPFIINFWATWCKPCVQELEAINEKYEQWQKETGVKIYAVSIDDSRSTKRVAPFTKSKSWAYEILLDENSDFRRAMGVDNPPFTFLYNGKGELVYKHTGYAPGDEFELYKKIKELALSESK